MHQEGFTALIAGAMNGHLNAVRLLLEYGANKHHQIVVSTYVVSVDLIFSNEFRVRVDDWIFMLIIGINGLSQFSGVARGVTHCGLLGV